MAEEKKERFRILKTFLMVVGALSIIFILLVIALVVYVIMTKPFGIEINPFNQTATSQDDAYDHPLLTTEQEKMIETLGVDVKTLPTSISPAQEKCATEKLGAQRVSEIKAGATPGLNDYLKAKECF